MLFLNFFYNSAQCETEQGGQVVKDSRIHDTPRRVPPAELRLECENRQSVADSRLLGFLTSWLLEF